MHLNYYSRCIKLLIEIVGGHLDLILTDENLDQSFQCVNKEKSMHVT